MMMKSNIYTFTSESRQPEMIFGDSFYCIETQEIVDIPTFNRCVVRWSYETKFLKKTIWRGTISKRGKEEAICFQKEWFREAKRRGLIPDVTIDLNHELEKAVTSDNLLRHKPTLRGRIDDLVDTLCLATGGLICEYRKSIDTRDIIIVCLCIVILILLNYLAYTETRISSIIQILEGSLKKLSN